MSYEICTPRREKLMANLAEKDAVIVFAALEQNLQQFRQENHFLYFTGLQVPDAIYFAFKGGMNTQILFIQRGIPENEVWDGKKMTIEEAREKSGIQDVKYLDQFEGVLGAYCPAINTIHANLGSQQLGRPLSYPMHRLKPVRDQFPGIVIKGLEELVTPLRKVKSDWEIMQMQRAIDITGKGILDILEAAEPGMMEYELEAMLFYRMQRSGTKQWGFSPIIAAGVNAATLHYKTNDSRIESGDLVLLDVGASYMNYSADITRCFPISGTFSERQKQIYEIVLSVQKHVISMIKPGVELSELQKATRDMIALALLEIGLIADASEVGKYYMHGVSHFLGMDTHDLGGRSAVLEAGNVITVEPGIYISEERLGVRIEDDVLVTEEGYCVLSQNIPKEISEIEEILKERS